ncbi:hypothetical protein [Aeoliella mucimassa]|uniref:Double zinc ribbon n=1 Tax=Aeoliella mucimassa TaxID=2527972 RepID=A0A518AGU3_9BACT|nr:hypothetical protein [Aeoliella mucimassa]QDU53945.1 hypothetical protein Pan181_01240 [Aeoliella mucimassa]
MKSLFALIAVTTLLATGCGESTTIDPSSTATAAPVEAVVLCKDCGQVKGSEACCAEGAEMCDCGFHHGSPACCKLEKSGEDITLCTKCGQAEGSEKCCAEGADLCPLCGLQVGSPGCVVEESKLVKIEDESYPEDE